MDTVAAATENEAEKTTQGDKSAPEQLKTKVDVIPRRVPDAPRFDNYFTVEVPQSIFYGKMLSGDFHQTKLSVGRMGRVGVEQARLNAGTIPDRETDFIHYKIAMCKVALVETPPWFADIEGFMDIDVLDRIYREVIRFENSFRFVARARPTEAA